MKIEVQIRNAKKRLYKTSTINEQYTITISNVGFFEKLFKKHLPNGIYRVFVLNPDQISIHNVTIKNRSKYLGTPPDYILEAIREFKENNEIDLQYMRDKGIW